MVRSWLGVGLTAAGCVSVLLLFRGHFAEGPAPADFAIAGGLYTLAFAARRSA